MIYVEGTTAGTITNGDGSYTFTIPAKSKYVTFSYVGFDTKKLHVEDTELFKLVSLAEQSNALDEVVVIGYGTQKKESMVASITSVKPSDLNITSSSLTTAFAGNIAGMISRQTSGERQRLVLHPRHFDLRVEQLAADHPRRRGGVEQHA